MFKHAFLAVVVCAFVLMGVQQATADTHVNGYRRSNGTYVAPHWRSDADSTSNNNWSKRGNVNPHTGKLGYKDVDGSSSYTGKSGYENVIDYSR